MKKFLLLTFLFAIYQLPFTGISAQNPDIKRTWHWYFGQNAGIDFSSGMAVLDNNGAYNNLEACASISDTSGNLLFYTDGETVYNKNHQVMQNGYSIGGCWSATQGALIVPQPGNDSIFYIFTTDCAENNLANGFRYTIVNMKLDSNRGDVIQSNIYLHEPVAEKITGVYHANKKDIWVVTHEWNSNNFLAYLVTDSGIDTIPVISSIGSIHSGGITNSNSCGYLKFSPNGKKIISVIYYSNIVELFDYNDSTGIISNDINLPVFYSGPCGASFSPNSSRLYLSYFGTGGSTPQPGKLLQYDILAGTSQDIINSQTLISAASNRWFWALQNAPDRKIYLSKLMLQ